jgi:hypothetical protein
LKKSLKIFLSFCFSMFEAAFSLLVRAFFAKMLPLLYSKAKSYYRVLLLDNFREACYNQANLLYSKGNHQMKATTSVLFIGNSYTYFNDMPSAIFAEMGKLQGFDLSVDSITKGGYTLESHADPSDPCGAQVEAVLTGEKNAHAQ